MAKVKEIIDKLPCYFWYVCSAVMFEGAISVLLGLIGMIFFDTTPYYYLTSALLGGMWSYRLHYMYETIRRISYKTKLDAEKYFLEDIFEADGHKLRRTLSILCVVADIILLIVLYYPILI